MRITPLGLTLLVLSASPAPADGPEGRGLEFFEQKIRPVLVKHCYECHSVEAKKHQGGLLLDSRAGILKGGESGALIVPGDPARSLLIKAVQHDGLRMPPKPKEKLADSVIADLATWIKMGAPDPRDQATARTATSWEEVLAKRRTWWSLQPVRKPAVPAVKDAAWSAHAVDRFLLAALEKQGLRPAEGADRRTLIRRLSLVLTGLPPAPDDVEAFVQDESPNAYEQLVDRLLAAPHFGEHWARHWLDVVRFAETHGNEWNYEAQFAWRYRDYLVRAFNQDLPYDQLVREHIAGDLLPQPRWNRADRFNESVLGTAFYRFGDGNVEDCSVVPQVAYDTVDNQIDTLSKAFQATTVACARGHDHKLDAVSMKDYYALVGILHSSRQLSHTIDAPEVNAQPMQALRELKAEVRKELGTIWLREAELVGRYLLAAQAGRAKAAGADALARGLDAVCLDRWLFALRTEKPLADDLLSLWRSANAVSAEAFPSKWRKQAERLAREEHERAEINRKRFTTFADFRNGSHGDWQAGGHGLRGAPSAPGDFALTPEGDTLLEAILPAGCFTHTLSDKLNGTLRSPILPRGAGKRISFEVMGRHSSAVQMVSHNCQFSDTNYRPLYANQLFWLTFKMPEDPTALRTYVELLTMFDNPKFPDPIVNAIYKDPEDYRVPWDKAAANPRSFFGVTRIVLHDGPEPPRPELGHLRPLFTGAEPATPDEAAARYAAVVKAAVQAWAAGRATDDDARWLDWLVRRGLLGSRADLTPRLAELAYRYRAVEKELALPRTIPGLGDCDAGFEQRLFVRGDCTRPAETVARRYLKVLSKPRECFTPTGSGRLELAERIARADNPLTARVLVNRVWHHLFGAGIVRTVDDFGQNGERPAHPELLDYLAARFVEDGWSVKRLVRALVLTRAFRMANLAAPAARDADPQDRLLHHYPARRLEAEAIRDAILAASGRLDRTLYGPSVEPYRDREIAHQRLFCGPLDGKGRRSLYIKHTLMEGPKFLGAFNFPQGNIMQGRRDVTNVPAQALALLNDPFVLQQAGVWSERLIARPDDSVAARLEHMFQTALGRPARPDEQGRFDKAVRRLAELHEVPSEEILKSPPLWKDVAHALFNMKEFIYIP